jgi:DNA-binding NtrC family response regulator
VQHIAVIDDDPLICDLLADALGDFGADVQCVTTGRSGRKLLTGKRFNLAIIDVVLPDASGLALAAIAANENTPVLLLTGHPRAMARLKQYEIVDIPCLLKPFDLVQLCAETERVMAESHQNVERIKEGMARLRANLVGREEAIANSERLIAESRRLVAKAMGSGPSKDRH